MGNRLILIIILILLAATSVSAYEMFREDGYKNEQRILDDDYFFLGNVLNMSGESDDLFFLGGTLNFSGKTRLGLHAVGQEISIDGEIGNGIIAVSNYIKISGDINDSSFLGGRSIVIEKDTVIKGPVFIGGERVKIEGRIEGDLFICAGWADITGQVEGNVHTYSGRLYIDNDINGDVVVNIGKIIITDNGTINGNLIYNAQIKPDKDDLKRVKGSIEIKTDEEKSEMLDEFSLVKCFFIIALTLSSLLILFVPGTKKLEEKRDSRSFWSGALWGLIPLLLYPGVVILSMIIVITIPLSLVLILAGIPVLFVTSVFGITMLGQYITRILKLNINQRHIFYIIGALLCFVLSYIPYASVILFIFISSLGWRYILAPVYNRFKEF